MRSSRSCRCRRACRSHASAWTTRATRLSWRRRSSGHDAGREARPVIPRYTRPELGRLWTDEARMESWRRVEVAACEELPGLLSTLAGSPPGPSPAELEAIRAATFSVQAVDERELTTDHDMAAF